MLGADGDVGAGFVGVELELAVAAVGEADAGARRGRGDRGPHRVEAGDGEVAAAAVLGGDLGPGQRIVLACARAQQQSDCDRRGGEDQHGAGEATAAGAGGGHA